MFVYTFICYLKTVKKYQFDEFGEIYIFLYQQLESGKRLFTTFSHIFDIKKDLELRF